MRALPILVLCAACATPTSAPPLLASVPDVAVSRPDDGAIAASWKERVAQPYVFLERRGDYRDLGAAMRELLQRAAALGIDAAGPPFALYLDDPGRVPLRELRGRACLTLAEPAADLPPELGQDVLPQAMVAYARVAGPYPEVQRAIPALVVWMAERGWEPAGAVREVYLVDPGAVASWSELEAELQIPWRPAASSDLPGRLKALSAPASSRAPADSRR
jgi:effector-binding domain-containing protein